MKQYWGAVLMVASIIGLIVAGIVIVVVSDQ